MPGSYLSLGCLPAIPGSGLTFAPVACQGTVLVSGQAIPVAQDAAAIGPLTGGDGTYFLALSPDAAGSPGSGWTRQVGSHYLWQKATAPPAGAWTLLAKVTVAAGAVTALDDLRIPASLVRRGTYDVDDPLYGGVADDTTDVGPALRAALAAAAANWGATVRLPAGRWALGSAVTIPQARGVTLEGDGWTAPAQQLFSTTAQAYRGTWIHIRSTSFTPFTIVGSGTTVRGIAFDHDQPVPAPGWAPTDYPEVFSINTPSTCCAPQTDTFDVTLANLFFYKATRGVHQRSLGGQAAGRINILGFWGQFFIEGLYFEFAADVVRMTDVHMWPHWSQDAHVMAYSEVNFNGIKSARLDDPYLSNIFIFGAFACYRAVINSIGSTSLVTAVNFTCDRAVIGVLAEQPNFTANFTNFVHNAGLIGAGVLPQSTGVDLQGDGDNVQITNAGVANVGSSCAIVSGNGELAITNIQCFNWNLAGSGAPALYATPGTMMVSGIQTMQLGNGATSNYGGNFQTAPQPGGAFFNQALDFFAGMIGGAPTMSFAPNNYLQYIPGGNVFKLGAAAGTYNTGGVTKYLCINNGVLTVGTTCP